MFLPCNPTIESERLYSLKYITLGSILRHSVTLNISFRFHSSPQWIAYDLPSSQEYRILRSANVYSKYSCRDVVLDFVLAERKRRSRKDRSGRPHGAHHDDPEFERERLPASCVLHKGHRHLDVRVSAVCVCGSHRIRRGKRPQS